MRIAVLDDDRIFLNLVEATIHQMGHATILFETGEDLLRAMRRESFDLLIVDWQLPGLSGIEVVRALREAGGSKLPILFASQRHEERDIVAAFHAGADDFMIKPLRVQELMARVNALMRRAYPDITTMRLDFAPYRLDPVARAVYLNDQAIELKHREYELAEFLFQNCGRLLSRNHLTEAVWGSITPTPSRTLDTHASRLRTKLQLGQFHGSGHIYQLSAIYGLGYRMELLPAPEESAAAIAP
ncbi:MAG: response regulator transcription factor [Comamonadaceae bacterium]|nr:response regulator transcription factor [Comamonadaceae bacterium]